MLDIAIEQFGVDLTDTETAQKRLRSEEEFRDPDHREKEQRRVNRSKLTGSVPCVAATRT
jgi:hypothetical protein